MVGTRRPDLSQLDEGASVSFNVAVYEASTFGPVGSRILERQLPDDMALLKACLERTDGPATVVVSGHLPIRRCDYALMIAEKILGRYEAAGNEHSFGPTTPYEYRDKARRDVLKALFGDDSLLHLREYVYLDRAGKDISSEYAVVPFHP